MQTSACNIRKANTGINRLERVQKGIVKFALRGLC